MKAIVNFYRSPARTGIKILVTSLVLGTLSALPLWLTLQFGDADGGATRVALLAMFGTLAGGLGAIVGVLWFGLELVFRRR
ncbi:hypothetical protein G3580_06090 [Nitrogeniibacter mangrovi]|uniref:Uncharacterized protein n=1 Tax=Nitrogeniibacter mangrovi TaxID=2016596 RepID=A0A6C1B0V8_9RHOO|nr:hypothetical protein [Nitrogeniibacter mangrovi]QID17251.1 hypothetical protein G3580_06090 [Nitrogeniibacter mangrovi]